MWSSVAPDDIKSAAPSARSKHSATVIGDSVYLLGGRNGNLPTRDFWKYNLVTGKWQQLKPTGEKLPCLQEHTAVVYRECLFVFGGEVGFSAGTETPLWMYDIKENTWKKIRTKKGILCPKGRRGHTALVQNGSMLIYGGYQDLRGSTSEMWSYHFDDESWHLLSTTSKNSEIIPPPRHKHSAILHENEMWIYGGMTDLQEKSDLWKWDITTSKWTNIKTKINPGPLHSHAACKMPSCMLVFGGERNGQTCNDLWKFTFSIESWEKITITGLKPQPRAESIAFTVSEFILNASSVTSLEAKAGRIRRSCNLNDRGSNNRHSSYLPNNRVGPFEKTYIFNASQNNYIDGSELAQQYSETNNRTSKNFLQEISKLSQINITRISNKCSYTVLTGASTDSTECLLRQHASPQGTDRDIAEIEVSTPSRGTMIKSKSAYVIKKKSPPKESEDLPTAKKQFIECDGKMKRMPREPVSVPNFSALTLPTPVLTPVETTKLVYLTDEENDLEDLPQKDDLNIYENFKPVKHGESYSSHLGYADNPLYQQMINSVVQEQSEENVSTSDYASIETMNRLSSSSNYSVKTATPQEENLKNVEKDKDGPFGFCNPNYMGPDIKALLNSDSDKDKKMAAKMLGGQQQKITSHCNKNFKSSDENLVELQNYDGVIDFNTKVFYRHSSRINRPLKSLALEDTECIHNKIDKVRALSASRAERNEVFRKLPDSKIQQNLDPYLPLYVYIIGGKEQGQVTVFQRPISIWKLKLF